MTRLSRIQIAKLWFTFVEKYDQKKAHRLLAQLIFEQKRQREMTSIVQTIQRLEFKRFGRATMTLTTARTIDDSTKQEIVDLMMKLTHAKSIQLQHTVNPKIIGGFVAQSNDLLVDASIKRSLSALESL